MTRPPIDAENWGELLNDDLDGIEAEARAAAAAVAELAEAVEDLPAVPTSDAGVAALIEDDGSETAQALKARNDASYAPITDTGWRVVEGGNLLIRRRDNDLIVWFDPEGTGEVMSLDYTLPSGFKTLGYQLQPGITLVDGHIVGDSVDGLYGLFVFAAAGAAPTGALPGTDGSGTYPDLS